MIEIIYKNFSDSIFLFYSLLVLTTGLIVFFKKYQSPTNEDNEKTILTYVALKYCLIIFTLPVIAYSVIFPSNLDISKSVPLVFCVVLILLMHFKVPYPKQNYSTRLNVKQIVFLLLSIIPFNIGFYIVDKTSGMVVGHLKENVTSNRNYEQWIKTTAIVGNSFSYQQKMLKKKEIGSEIREVTRYVFRYTYVVDNVQYNQKRCTLEVFDDGQYCQQHYYKGQKIDIFYEPEHPEYATVLKKTSGPLGYFLGLLYYLFIILPMYLIFFGVGAIFFLFTVLMIVVQIRDMSGNYDFLTAKN